MDIVFITNDLERHEFEGATYNSVLGKPLVEGLISHSVVTKTPVAIDTEATGLDAYYLTPLLLGVGNANIQYCIDLLTVDISDWYFDPRATYLGQNLKYDLKIMIVKYNVHLRNIYDTMIAEQKIFQGAQADKWFLFNLEAITYRHLQKSRTHGKDTRMQFVGANTKTFYFTQTHIEYLAEDLVDLHAIREKQLEYIKEYDMMGWLYNVEFPLVYFLAQCELNGFVLDTENWQKNIDESIILRHKYSIQLDEEMRRLRNSSTNPNAKRLYGGKFDSKRTEQTNQTFETLFGAVDAFTFYNAKNAKGSNVKLDKKKGTVKIDNNTNNVNWGGDDLLYVLACLGIPVPLQGEAGRKYKYLSPKLHDTKKCIVKTMGYDENGTVCHINAGTKEGYTTGKDSLTKYLVENPTTPIRTLIMLLKQYREVDHEITAFGDKFFDMINTVTGRIHTTFRQANAFNSRFQSGGGRNESDKYNCQNIPRKKKFRHCFMGEPLTDRNGEREQPSIATCDLAGAEVLILADKSGDENLKNWAVNDDDTHSPMVQNTWRHIFLYRAGIAAAAWFNTKGYATVHRNPNVIASIDKVDTPDVQHNMLQYRTFVVSKKVNVPYRQAGKNGTFGGIYGMKPVKAAETFNGTDTELAKVDPNYTPVNVTKEEGEVILLAQKAAIPNAYKFVEQNVQKAFSQGYLMYDTRSKSRIWFPAVIKLFQKINEEHKENYGLENVDILYLGKGKYRVPQSGLDYNLEGYEINDIDGKARNIPISGTQADCVKEAIVDIGRYLVDNDITDIKWMKQVHDELVYSMPKNTDGQSKQWEEEKVTHKFVYDEPVEVDSLSHTKHESVVLNNDGKVEAVNVSFPEFIRLSMIEAANRHMSTIKMGAEVTVLDSWTK